jgi:pantoate--beta-alanine ligase
MKRIYTPQEWKNLRSAYTAERATLGFVPTMGALHQGHLSLVGRSMKENHRTVVSIYVNPTQFNNPQDFALYPSSIDEDLTLLEESGVDAVFTPTYETLYPDGYEVRVLETELSKDLCGASRPGHFEGVLTVVLKLLNIIGADKAYFGEKDYQQYLLIRKMAQALFLHTEIIPCPIVREDSGLAMSSRNRRLSPEGLALAPAFHRILSGTGTVEAMGRELEELGFISDYIQEAHGRRFGAAYLENVRLIDNVPL